MGGTGPVHPLNSPGKSEVAITDSAQNGAQRPIGPELVKIVAAWPSLPEPIKRAVLALIGN